jgi:enoyl-CoA hydratase/carnithine racemase
MMLNQPKALNALNAELFAELNEALHLVNTDKNIGVIIITWKRHLQISELLALHYVV